MKFRCKPKSVVAAVAVAAAAAVGVSLVTPTDAAPRHRAVAHKSVAKKVTVHRSRAPARRITKSVHTSKTIKRTTTHKVVKPSTAKVTKSVKHTTIAKPKGITRTTAITKTTKVAPAGFKTMKFKSGNTKLVKFTGQKGLKHKPSNFVKPAHIVHNPKHIAGLHGFHHHHRPFFFRHGGLRWHRWYYPVAVGGLWYWYWYNLPADNDPAVVSLADTAIPECEIEEDECVELDE